MNQVKDISESDNHKMHKENALDKEECERVTRSSYLGESYKPDSDSPGAFRKAFYSDVLYRDPKIDGFIIRMPHGTVIHQAERTHYYRGERYEYPASIPSLQREINEIDDPVHKECYRIVAYMRIAEFDHFIHRLDRVKSWEERGLTVLTDALAQHYGLKTDWLDITNDFDTALFFANCKFDEDNGWSPLSNADTEQKRETQYGVLFRSTSERINIENMSRCFNERRIALRVGTRQTQNPRGAGLVYDFQFMVQTNNGAWAEVHGIGPSVLHPIGETPETIPWTAGGVPYYDSRILYFAITDFHFSQDRIW